MLNSSSGFTSLRSRFPPLLRYPSGASYEFGVKAIRRWQQTALSGAEDKAVERKSEWRRRGEQRIPGWWDQRDSWSVTLAVLTQQQVLSPSLRLKEWVSHTAQPDTKYTDYRSKNIKPVVFGINLRFSGISNARIQKIGVLCWGNVGFYSYWNSPQHVVVFFSD